MSYNGSGLFSINTTGQPVVSGTTIESAVFNTLTADLATGLSTAICKDGQTTVTANIPLGGYKLTGVGAATALTDAATLLSLQNQVGIWCGTAAGTANALTLTPAPAITAYVAGQTFVFKSGASANSGATTLAISSLATIAIQTSGAACAGGEIQASKWYRVTLDTTSTCQLEPLHGPSISGAYPVVLTATAATAVTLPTTGTLITTSGTETLTNKTINLSSNTLTGTLTQFNTACSDADFASLAGTETLTNKTLTTPVIAAISNTGTLTLPTSTDTLVGRATTDTLTNKTVNLSSNTLTGTTAQFNTALSDGDFATLAGTETLTNKTFSLASNTLTGTTAQFNTALSDGDFATLAGTETLTNKTLSLGSNTVTTTKAQLNTAVTDGEVTFQTASTGSSILPTGTTGERDGTPAAGYLRFNTTSSEFEGYNGSAWSSVGGATVSNDTSTSSNIYPLSASATSGTASTVYTSNAKLLYKPSTGELQASELVASNGLVVNNATVSASYTIASGYNAMSVGPVTVSGGVSVTITGSQRWVVL